MKEISCDFCYSHTLRTQSAIVFCYCICCLIIISSMFRPLSALVCCFPVSFSGCREDSLILGEDDSGPPPPQLFTELDELLAVDGQEMEWKETAR